jgi:hypothetical protein
MTTIRIDAPTQHQFDLPRQNKIARDVVKSLDNAQRWGSKITGAQVAGAGMFAFVARTALGGGPNLTCMVLHHLALLFALLASRTNEWRREPSQQLVKPMDFSRTHVTSRPENALRQSFPMGSERWDPICEKELTQIAFFTTGSTPYLRTRFIPSVLSRRAVVDHRDHAWSSAPADPLGFVNYRSELYNRLVYTSTSA